MRSSRVNDRVQSPRVNDRVVLLGHLSFMLVRMSIGDYRPCFKPHTRHVQHYEWQVYL